MKRSLVTLILGCVGLAGVVTGQTVRTWTSNSDQRWNRNANWSGSNQPNANNEIAEFGTGSQLNPELNANNLTVRGLRFSTGAAGYNVGDDNGSRALKIGNGTSGFIENLGTSTQAISIGTLSFQSDSSLTTTGTGGLTISSTLTGSNRNLTFSTVGDITVSGAIATGSGTLTKQGAGTLNLSGSNTYTGQTSINAGAILLQASNVFADAARINISSGATLGLNDLTDTISRISGSGAIDFGSTGAGQLTLGSGASTFAGALFGRGELIIGAGASLTLGADFNNSNLNLTLAGGTLNLAGHSLTVGAFDITGNSIIDFASGADSLLSVGSLGFSATGIGLTVKNWTDAADFFYSQTGYLQGSAPLDQVQFQGWTVSDTKWQSFDDQITPVPESRIYGAALLLVTAGLLGWWRHARARA